jgi:hypothetical protein
MTWSFRVPRATQPVQTEDMVTEWTEHLGYTFCAKLLGPKSHPICSVAQPKGRGIDAPARGLILPIFGFRPQQASGDKNGLGMLSQI